MKYDLTKDGTHTFFSLNLFPRSTQSFFLFLWIAITNFGWSHKHIIKNFTQKYPEANSYKKNNGSNWVLPSIWKQMYTILLSVCSVQCAVSMPFVQTHHCQNTSFIFSHSGLAASFIAISLDSYNINKKKYVFQFQSKTLIRSHLISDCTRIHSCVDLYHHCHHNDHFCTGLTTCIVKCFKVEITTKIKSTEIVRDNVYSEIVNYCRTQAIYSKLQTWSSPSVDDSN